MRRLLSILIVTLAATATASAAGLMKPKDGSLPALQIKDHKVSVVINNGFAVTEVDQVFFFFNDREI